MEDNGVKWGNTGKILVDERVIDCPMKENEKTKIFESRGCRNWVGWGMDGERGI